MQSEGQTLNLKLVHQIYGKSGVFSSVSNDAGFLFLALEHAYEVIDNSVSPPSITYVTKIPPGIYECVRGKHHIHSKDPKGNIILIEIETFEITGIPDFQGERVTGCLFHAANYNEELEGCVAPGLAIGNRIGGKEKMITWSVKAFNQLMDLQKGEDKFLLTVE